MELAGRPGLSPGRLHLAGMDSLVYQPASYSRLPIYPFPLLSRIHAARTRVGYRATGQCAGFLVK